jgi:hypothetical protein
LEDNNQLELGAWIGRNQAFHLLADHCLAARAQCLETVRESGAYRALNLTWDEFCTRHTGMSRSNADRLIRKRKQFGDAYFRLSEVMRISPVAYRRIESSVTPEGLELHQIKPRHPGISGRKSRVVREVGTPSRPLPQAPSGVFMAISL